MLVVVLTLKVHVVGRVEGSVESLLVADDGALQRHLGWHRLRHKLEQLVIAQDRHQGIGKDQTLRSSLLVAHNSRRNVTIRTIQVGEVANVSLVGAGNVAGHIGAGGTSGRWALHGNRLVLRL